MRSGLILTEPLAAPPAEPRPAARRGGILRTLGSLKMAVCLILGIAVYSTLGMWWEGRAGAEGSRAWFWGPWYFDALLGLLGVNIASAALVRYPWPRRLTGFVITHAGLLVLLAGSFVTRYFGMEGHVALAEGERTDWLTLPHEVLEVTLPDGTTRSLRADAGGAWTRGSPWRLDRSPYAIRVERYLPSSTVEERFAPAEPGLGPPALEVALESPMFGTQAHWLLPTERERSQVDLEGMLVLAAQWLPTADAERAFGDVTPRAREYRVYYDLPADGAAGTRTARVRLGDATERTFVVDDWLGRPFDLGDGARATVQRALANVRVVAGPDGRFVLEDSPDAQAGPALEVEIAWDGGRQEHTAFARFPEMHSRRGHGAAVADRNAVLLGCTPDGRVLARLNDPTGRADGTARPLAIGEALATPWAGIAIRARQMLPSAERKLEIVEGPAPDGNPAHAVPAAQLHVLGAGDEAHAWIRLGADGQIVHHGAGHLRVRWGAARHPLGFALRLRDFRKVDYPGTTSPASFESDVDVADFAGARMVTIRMNEPLVQGARAWWPGSGLTFYQSSFEQHPDGTEISVFSVAHDPGFPIVMLGSGLIVFGIFTMFYLIPYFTPRRRGVSPPAAGAAGAGTPAQGGA